jgi:ABC-type sugar transport system substrate-binding protein
MQSTKVIRCTLTSTLNDGWTIILAKRKGSVMKKPRLLLSVTNDSNDFQIEQVKGAREAAARLGADLEVVYAQDNGVVQSQQLLQSIQSTTAPHPDVIIFEPAGSTTLPQVARAAAAKGIGWVVLSRDAEYIAELRSAFRIAAFVVTADHKEIGRIQGRQLAAFVPGGGTVLTILGPSQSKAASLRHAGLLETKPENIHLRSVKGHWTEVSAQKAVHSWLALSTSRTMDIVAVCAQDDSMAIGARKAFEESSHELRASWLEIPFLGCDGMPETGQEWVRRGLLTATVLSPPTAPVAIDLVARFLKLGTMPPPCTRTKARSIPPIDTLKARTPTVE